MEAYSIVGLILVAINVLVSYKGFQDENFLESYWFSVEKINVAKEFERLISSGFLHANWFHLLLNMAALYSFSPSVEALIGLRGMLVVYFAALLGGNLLALYFHRNHLDYKALGASGAVSGIVFAAIILDPLGEIGFMFLPFVFKAWVFGAIFIIASIFAIKSQLGNIGHEAHLGGAVIGLLTTLFFWPEGVALNGLVLLLLLVPTSIFMLVVGMRPTWLLMDSAFPKIRTQPKKAKREKQSKSSEMELNALLDKIAREGINSLSKAERKRLNDLSGKMKK